MVHKVATWTAFFHRLRRILLHSILGKSERFVSSAAVIFRISSLSTILTSSLNLLSKKEFKFQRSHRFLSCAVIKGRLCRIQRIQYKHDRSISTTGCHNRQTALIDRRLHRAVRLVHKTDYGTILVYLRMSDFVFQLENPV